MSTACGRLGGARQPFSMRYSSRLCTHALTASPRVSASSRTSNWKQWVPLLLNVLLVGPDLSPLEALVNAGDRVKVNRRVENKRHTNAGQHLASYSAIGATIPPHRQTFSFNGLDSF